MTAYRPTPTTHRNSPVVRTDDAYVAEATFEETRGHRAYRYTLAVTRIVLGSVFMWAFIDKMFGLGYATPAKGAWIDGGSPTAGFLGHATAGPFADFYQSFAGAAWADALFMAALFGIGLALILGVTMRIAAVSGVTLLLMMWSAVLPPANNPVLDDHIVYALVLVILVLASAGRTFGLGRIWERRPLVNRFGALR
ncbi:MAG: hypothetical protein ABIM89_03190 [Mycobacteriales bacterium]